MIKVLLDTSVWISSFRPRPVSSDPNNIRHPRAKNIIQYLVDNNYEICYSERSRIELAKDTKRDVLNDFTMLGSHDLNFTWEEQDTLWENSKSIWGDESEVVFGDKLERLLPNKKNLYDRGIFGDAVKEKCQIIIHEDGNFDRLEVESITNDILQINLLNIDLSEAIYSLKERKKINE